VLLPALQALARVASWICHHTFDRSRLLQIATGSRHLSGGGELEPKLC
jgi:hypothetical protein